jgi:hypothetical protein
MKTWSNVVDEALLKIADRVKELEKDLPRIRLSVAALAYIKAEGKQYLMRDKDWTELENAFLLAGYAVVRFGTQHVGLIMIGNVARWPRVNLLAGEGLVTTD